MSDAVDDTTRLRRWQQALAEAGRGSATRPGCPPPERLWEAARGELDATQVRELLDHASLCPGCSLAWRLAAEMVPHESVRGVESRPGRRPGRWMLAAAAAALALLVLTPLVLDRDRPAKDEVREAPRPGIGSLVEGQTLDRDDCVLRWTPVPGSLSYSVLVGTEDLDVLTRGVGLASPELRIPPQSLEPLPRGATLIWRVEARLENGERISSPTFVNPVR